MQRVRWPDNICAVGWTCVHGWFTPQDLRALWELCPEGHVVPTFFSGVLPARALHQADMELLEQMGEGERGYYFDFPEATGKQVLAFLQFCFPLVRGEGCG